MDGDDASTHLKVRIGSPLPPAFIAGEREGTRASGGRVEGLRCLLPSIAFCSDTPTSIASAMGPPSPPLRGAERDYES